METLGCVKAKLGTTTYYITKMTAGELIKKVGVVKELPEWANMTYEEKLRREFDINHIIEKVVPYIVEDPDHFLSSFIVDVFYGFEEIEFEPLNIVSENSMAAYTMSMRDMGFITLPGQARLITLDSQNELLGLKIAIQGTMGIPAGTRITSEISNLEPHPELAEEEVSIILLKHTDDEKIRKLFNRFNKRGRPANKSIGIIENKTDIFAIIAKRLTHENGPLAPISNIELVNCNNAALPLRSKNLTTLGTLYTIAEILLNDEGYTSETPAEPRILEKAYQNVSHFWTVLLEKMKVYKEYLDLTHRTLPVSKLREDNLLMRPTTQVVLAYVSLETQRNGIKWEDAVDKLDRLDWGFNNPIWQDILVTEAINKKVIRGSKLIKNAGIKIARMIVAS